MALCLFTVFSLLATAVARPLAQTSNRTEVYFGDGCYWERQYAYVQVEMNVFNRSMAEVTAHTGYGGSAKKGNDGLVCYHHAGGDQSDDYADLGYTEANSVLLDAGKEEEQYAALVENYFNSFTDTGSGMQRPDPGDEGAQYRSCLAIPGGMSGPLYKLITKYNTHKMNLIDGKGCEGDQFNAVYIYDSEKLPFFRAEQYMQFHCNFAPPSYPVNYTRDLYNLQIKLGLINQTGCPEDPDSRGEMC